MNFEDLKDKLREMWARLKSEVDENPQINTLKEKFETLPSKVQRSILAGVAAFALLMLISFPMSYFSQATQYENEFLSTRALLRELLKVGKPMNPNINMENRLEFSQIKERIDGLIPTFNLMAEQVGGVVESNSKGPSLAKPPIVEDKAQLTMKNLNLDQLVQISYEMQKLFPNVKMTGIDVSESAEHPNYFNVIYTLSKFTVPESELDEKKGSKNSKRPSKRGK